MSSSRSLGHTRLPGPSTASGWPYLGGGCGPRPRSQKPSTLSCHRRLLTAMGIRLDIGYMYIGLPGGRVYASGWDTGPFRASLPAICRTLLPTRAIPQIGLSEVSPVVPVALPRSSTSRNLSGTLAVPASLPDRLGSGRSLAANLHSQDYTPLLRGVPPLKGRNLVSCP